MNFNAGEWIVEALKTIEQSKHVRRMAYWLVFALVIHAIAALISAL